MDLNKARNCAVVQGLVALSQQFSFWLEAAERTKD